MRDTITAGKAFGPVKTPIYEQVQGEGAVRLVRVFKDITWVREAQTRIVFSHGGEVLKDGYETADYSRFLDSLSVLEELPGIMRKYDITENSSLVLSVEARLIDKPTLGELTTPSHRPHMTLYKPALGLWVSYFANKWTTPSCSLSDIPDVPREEALRKGSPIMLKSHRHSVSVIWTSKQTEEENARALAEFRNAAHRPGPLDVLLATDAAQAA